MLLCSNYRYVIEVFIFKFIFFKSASLSVFGDNSPSLPYQHIHVDTSFILSLR